MSNNGALRKTDHFSNSGTIVNFFKRREATLLIILFSFIIILIVTTDTFLSSINIFNVTRQASLLIIVAIAETMVLVSGGIDLSVGSIVAVTSIIAALSNRTGHPPLVVMLLGLSCGALFGFFNGFMIAKVKINPFIITLGSFNIASGVALVITKGYSIPVKDSFLLELGQGYIGPVPIPVVIMAVVFAIICILFYKTIFGSNIKAIGGNEEAAVISGINVGMNKIGVYLISGILSSLAAIVLTGRLNVGQATAGSGWEMQAVAAAILGGTTLSGGEGSIPGTLIGALLLAFLSNGMVLLGVSMYFQQIVTGAIIVIVVTIDVVRKRKG